MAVKFALNGKFAGARTTGVQRVATEITREMDTILEQDAEAHPQVQLLMPPGAADLHLKQIKSRYFGPFSGSLWEQLTLPWVLRKVTLLNLCNLGPALRLNSITMLHDAQVFSAPASYSAAFRLWYRFIQPWLGHHGRLTLSVSEFSKQELVKYGVAPAHKIAVVHNGVDHVLRLTPDTTIVERHKLHAGSYVIALANVQNHKNIKVLLEAFHDIEGDLKLVLYGRADREALQTLTPKTLGSNIIAVGPVTDEEMAGLMQNALCIAFPSRTEGFGLPPLEAMLLGCPAIVAPCGALPEVCGDAVLYADPDNSADWAKKIVHMFADRDLRDRYATAGQAQAAQFTWRRAALRILNLIAQKPS